jgi:hypothetical protein
MRTSNLQAALICFIVGVSLLAMPPTAAAGLEEKFFFGAFGGWAYKKTDRNPYLNGNDKGSYDNVGAGITFGAYPVEQLKVQGQFFAHAGGGSEVDLDWAMAEWTFNSHFKLRAGKIKQPAGLYSETLEVGVARPFFDLPQSVYGASGVQGEAFLGGGFTGEVWSNDDWSISYDIYSGKVELEFTEPWEQIEAEEHEEEEYDTCISDGSDPLLCDLISESGEAGHGGHSELDVTSAFGWRLGIDTPFEGLSISTAGFVGDSAEGYHSTVGVSVQYALDFASFQGEYFHTKRKGNIEWDAAYVQTAYRPCLQFGCGPAFLDGVEIAMRYDWLDGKSLGEKIESRYRTHEEFSVGLNYWFSPGFVIKASYHRVYGNLFAFDMELLEEGRLKRSTDSVVVGVHFAF